MVASRKPVSYILKTSVTRSSSLADNLGALWGFFAFLSCCSFVEAIFLEFHKLQPPAASAAKAKK
jgi:hypothetical protein